MKKTDKKLKEKNNSLSEQSIKISQPPKRYKTFANKKLLNKNANSTILRNNMTRTTVCFETNTPEKNNALSSTSSCSASASSAKDSSTIPIIRNLSSDIYMGQIGGNNLLGENPDYQLDLNETQLEIGFIDRDLSNEETPTFPSINANDFSDKGTGDQINANQAPSTPLHRRRDYSTINQNDDHFNEAESNAPEDDANRYKKFIFVKAKTLIPLLIIYLNSITARKIPTYETNRLFDLTVAEDNKVESEHPIKSKKHYQDVYVAQNSPKELEFGHVCEDPNEWEQRFEKIDLDNLNRQGKIRWGDKNGGYVEHYYDFNHGDQDDDENDENKEDINNKIKKSESRISEKKPQRNKRSPDEDVEFINDEAKSKILNERTPKHGGNYRRAKTIRSKRQRIKASHKNPDEDDEISSEQY